jgi:hypothetical protein
LGQHFTNVDSLYSRPGWVAIRLRHRHSHRLDWGFFASWFNKGQG